MRVELDRIQNSLTALQENEIRTDPAAVVELSAGASDDWTEENRLSDSEVLIFPAFLTYARTHIRKERKIAIYESAFMAPYGRSGSWHFFTAGI